MALGPGKYDPECTRIMKDQQADGVIVIVFNGKLGNGFSCQGTMDIIAGVPTILRSVADNIENSGGKA